METVAPAIQEAQELHNSHAPDPENYVFSPKPLNPSLLNLQTINITLPP